MASFGSTLLVSGPESFLAQRAVARTRTAALAERPDADVNEIMATELEDTMLSEVVGGSLFSSDIIAVIDDVGACPAGVVDQLVEVAKNPGDDLCLILVHQGGNKGKGLIDKLKKAKVPTETVAAVKPWDLPKFVAEEARGRGVRISSDAAGELVAAVGNDMRALAAAVAQLADDADGGQIDSSLIKRYFAGRAEVTSFAVADAVLAGNANVAMERLRWALGTGAAPVLITSAMASAFRGMGRYLDASNSRLSGPDLARQVGVPPFKLKEYARTSRNWGAGSVASAIQLIAVGDAEVKGAATDPAFALERMVLGVLALTRR